MFPKFYGGRGEGFKVRVGRVGPRWGNAGPLCAPLPMTWGKNSRRWARKPRSCSTILGCSRRYRGKNLNHQGTRRLHQASFLLRRKRCAGKSSRWKRYGNAMNIREQNFWLSTAQMPTTDPGRGPLPEAADVAVIGRGLHRAFGRPDAGEEGAPRVVVASKGRRLAGARVFRAMAAWCSPG